MRKTIKSNKDILDLQAYRVSIYRDATNPRSLVITRKTAKKKNKAGIIVDPTYLKTVQKFYKVIMISTNVLIVMNRKSTASTFLSGTNI